MGARAPPRPLGATCHRPTGLVPGSLRLGCQPVGLSAAPGARASLAYQRRTGLGARSGRWRGWSHPRCSAGISTRWRRESRACRGKRIASGGLRRSRRWGRAGACERRHLPTIRSSLAAALHWYGSSPVGKSGHSYGSRPRARWVRAARGLSHRRVSTGRGPCLPAPCARRRWLY